MVLLPKHNTVNCFFISLQNDIEIPIPKYFIRENSQAIKERDKMMGTILAGMKETQAPSQVSLLLLSCLLSLVFPFACSTKIFLNS